MYTHEKGKGAGKYNGMKRSGDWVGKKIVSARKIQNNGGTGVMAMTLGVVNSAHNGINATFVMCPHCGTVLHVTKLD